MDDIPPLMWRCHCGHGPMTPAEFDAHRVACGHRTELARLREERADLDYWRTRAEQAERERDAWQMRAKEWRAVAESGKATIEHLDRKVDDANQAALERDALVERIAALEARIADLTPTVDCGACGLAMPISTIVADDDELTCHGCGARNRLAVDLNEVYVAHYVCRHGVDPEDAECETCANAPDKGEP